MILLILELFFVYVYSNNNNLMFEIMEIKKKYVIYLQTGAASTNAGTGDTGVTEV